MSENETPAVKTPADIRCQPGENGYLLEQQEVEHPQPEQSHFWQQPVPQLVPQSQFWHVQAVQHCVLAAGTAGAAAAVCANIQAAKKEISMENPLNRCLYGTLSSLKACLNDLY